MKICIITNNDVGLYKFRNELIDELLAQKHEIHLILPMGNYIHLFTQKGCYFYQTNIERHGTNPIKDYNLYNRYKKILKTIMPDVVLTYTIKPNIYGGIACANLNIPYIANITGLGSAVEKKGPLQKLTIVLYKVAFRKIKCVFFQNKDNKQFFLNHNIAINKQKILPGSGVNLTKFNKLSYPTENTINFSFISRIMKEKGIEEYLEAAIEIKKRYPNVIFHVCGFCEEEYEEKLTKMEKQGIIVYHGMVKNIQEILKITHCVVHPSFYPEGISNVLLESAASARPIITTNRPGCKEVIEENINGLISKEKDSQDLIDTVEKFINLSWEKKKLMGELGRKKVEKEFDRTIVINAYLKELSLIKK